MPTSGSGIHAFELESELCAAAAERAIEIAEQAGADFERVWALSFLALGKAASADSFALFDQSIEEALEKGYGRIASGVFHNEIWTRVHSLAGDLRRPLEKGDRIPSSPWISTGGSIARSWAELALGRPREALEQARDALAHFDSFGATSSSGAPLAAAEALLELGRAEEAADELPPPSPGAELQDIVYDTPARLGIALSLSGASTRRGARRPGRKRGSHPLVRRDVGCRRRGAGCRRTPGRGVGRAGPGP